MKEPKIWIERHPEDPFYDHVEVQLVDRYKTSGLSGDEWRYSYRVRLNRKGKTIAHTTVNGFEYAVSLAAAAVHLGFVELEMDAQWSTVPFTDIPGDGICCHPGCPLPATSTYVLKDVYDSSRCFSKPNGGDYEGQAKHARQFCDRHRRRGDCSRDDADHNYIPVVGKGPEDADVDPEKVSESVFGGFVEVGDAE